MCDNTIYSAPIFFLSATSMKALTIYPQGPQAENSFLPLIQGCWALCWGLCTDYHDKIIQLTENLFGLDPFKTSEAH